MPNANSNALYNNALKYFPGGVNSPVRAFQSVGGTPLFIDRGQGAKIWDADNNEYIDFCCSWGPLILGHCHPAVVQAVQETAAKGMSFGAPTREENELASLILSNNQYVEKIRFVNSGTEATMSAIRLARGYTGRNKIIKFEGCYHGHADHLLVKAGSGLATLGTSSSAGVPESFANETIVLPLNDRQAVKQAFSDHRNDIACIIIEPIPANNGLLLQDREYLEFLRETTAHYGTLLIFDEVISGFRIGFEGAAGHYNIAPDLITYGKIIGGGMPVGAYAGKAEIMAKIAPVGDVYQAGTLSGNPVAMAAGIAQLTECLKHGFYETLEKKTIEFTNTLKSTGTPTSPVQVVQIGSIFWLAFSNKEHIKSAADISHESMNTFTPFYHALLQQGIYLGPSGYEVGFVSAAHTTEDLEKAAAAFQVSLKIASAAV